MTRQPRPGALRIEVDPPTKTADRYEFTYRISRPPYANQSAPHSFGFQALNFQLRHSEIWDSVFPLMFLTRNGGPLFNRARNSAVIRFRYPILESVRQFFVERAANFGLSIDVEADTFDRRYDISASGSMLAFGGGKESRLLYGLLHELGEMPRTTMGGCTVIEAEGETDHEVELAAGLSAIEISRPFRGTLAERIMPGFMAGAANFYLGTSLVDVHLVHPWHQHYDIGSWQGLRELTDLFHSLGLDLTMHAPLSGVPSNIIQKMLVSRFPELHKSQWSVAAGAATEKNLHVSLLKLYHDIPFASHCSDDLLRQLLRDFVSEKLANPLDFGFHDVREVVQREMMSIIWRRKTHPLLSEVSCLIPAEWDASWIDFLHAYVNPDVSPSFLGIFRQYAKDYAPDSGEYRFPAPGS